MDKTTTEERILYYKALYSFKNCKDASLKKKFQTIIKEFEKKQKTPNKEPPKVVGKYNRLF